MADISIQFHALPDELLAFVQHVAAEFGLYVVAMRFFPFEATEISVEQLPEIFGESSPYVRLAFTLGRPSLPVTSGNQFFDQNPGSLRLEIGRLSERGLAESWLDVRSAQAEAMSVWKKIARQFKAMTQAGAMAVNTQTGATGFVRSHRFTEGARRLESEGVTMLPVAGTSVYKLGSQT